MYVKLSVILAIIAVIFKRKTGPLTTFKVSEKTYGQIPRKLPEGRREGRKDSHDHGVKSVKHI